MSGPQQHFIGVWDRQRIDVDGVVVVVAATAVVAPERMRVLRRIRCSVNNERVERVFGLRRRGRRKQEGLSGDRGSGDVHLVRRKIAIVKHLNNKTAWGTKKRETKKAGWKRRIKKQNEVTRIERRVERMKEQRRGKRRR
jgi:hypothetical protein